MTKGILGVVACPMLEDELIYSLKNDPEEKHIYVVETKYDSSVKRKMEKRGLQFTSIDEWDFQNHSAGIDPEKYNVVIIMNNLALHAEPKDLMNYVQDELVMLKGRVDAVALYYGMCGNYGWDISKWADEHLNYPVKVFRDSKGRVCDDCVGVAVGGLDGYQRLIKEYTGVLLFTPAVAINQEDFLAASDLMKGALGGKTREENKANMKMILQLCGYNSIVQIDTGLEDRKEFDEATKEWADYLGFKVLQAEPDYPDLGPTKRLYQESKKCLDDKAVATP